MDNKYITDKRNQILELLIQKRLFPAFESIKELLIELSDWYLNDKFEELENGYKYMLQYMQQGVSDPLQRQVYKKFLKEAYIITDRISDKLFLKEAYNQYYTKRRYYLSGSDTLTKIYSRLDKDLGNLALIEIVENVDNYNNDQINKLRINIEVETDNLFNYIWTSYNCSEEDMVIIKEIFDETILPMKLKALLVSALTMSILQYFEESKFNLLLSLASGQDELIKQRPIVGVYLSIIRYDSRIILSDNLLASINQLKQDNDFVKSIITIQNQFIKARETDSITRKMNEEIIPEMLKMNPSVSNKLSEDINSLDLSDLDYNPEWEEYLKESGISKKLKEISELQLEGADVLMGTFSNLKGFPFFSRISNWFMPFEKNNSFISDLFQSKTASETFLGLIETSRFMCNSDKYSFCLSMLQLPPQQRSVMAEQFAEQGNQMKELEKAENSLIPEKDKAEIISNQYLQDLYRFFKLNYNKSEFSDIFNLSLSIYKNNLISDIFESDSLRLIAELLFKKKYYKEALNIFSKIISFDNSDHSLYQKIGYCYQELGEYHKAINAYNNSDIIKKDSPWTIRRIATCYKALKNYNTAIEYYNKYLTFKPDTLSVELNLGHCHLALKNYEQALNHYFKVEYLESKNIKTWRPIAWCSFKLGKYDQASKYYHKILENKANAIDHINAGHNYWANNKIDKAIIEYQKSLNLLSEPNSQFPELYLQDKMDLLEAGIADDDISIMLDEVLFKNY